MYRSDKRENKEGKGTKGEVSEIKRDASSGSRLKTDHESHSSSV